MNNISIIRSVSFISVLIIMNLLQFIIPSRSFKKDRWQFMLSNLVLVAFNNILLGFLPLIPYTMAELVVQKNWGLFQILELPNLISLLLGLALLDLTIYFQHRMFHQVDILWRLHSMHHVDPMLDTTSGLRFHPFEIFLSSLIKISVIFLLGITPLTVVVFEIGLNLLAMFNHSNIKINKKAEDRINKILITPALHTIHHSKIRQETNSNYGFSVPWWDKLFNTFTPYGKYPQESIHIGTYPMPAKTYQLFPGMLVLPFMKNK